MSDFNFSSDVAVTSLADKFPILEMFLLLSTTSAFDADAVPAVTPSIVSSSASVI